MDIDNITLDIKEINIKNKIKETIKTLEGDTWDLISLIAFEDEKHTDILMYANKENVDKLQFNANEVIKIPVLTKESLKTLPPWRIQ